MIEVVTRPRRVRSIVIIILVVTVIRSVNGEPAPDRGLLVLKDNCFACHNTEKHKGGLILTSRADLLRGNKDGPVVVLNKSEESRLIKALEAEADPHMPPKKQLAADEMAMLRAWIDAGAPWDEKLLEASATTRPVELRALPAEYRPVLALALSPDEKRLAVGRGSLILLYALGEKEPLVEKVLEGSRDSVQSLAWSDDGNLLAAGDYRRASVWDLRSPETPVSLSGLNGRVTALLFLRGETGLLAADGDAAASGRIVLYRLPDTNPQKIVPAHADSIFALRRTRDGSLLASAGADKLVKLWRLPSFEEIARLEGHSGHILGLSFKPDGSLLASGGGDRDVKVWDVKTHEQKATIGPHAAAVTSLAWAGDHLLAATEDGGVRVNSESELGRALPAADDVLYGIAVTSDGTHIYGGCHDGAVYLWTADGKLESKLTGMPARNPNR